MSLPNRRAVLEAVVAEKGRARSSDVRSIGALHTVSPDAAVRALDRAVASLLDRV